VVRCASRASLIDGAEVLVAEEGVDTMPRDVASH